MKNNDESAKALSFISSGVACFALIFLDRLGILDELINFGKVNKNQIKNSEDDLIIDTALLELELNGILKKADNIYELTPLGVEVVHYSGLIHYIYRGYCNVLSNPKEKTKINHTSVIRGSNLLGEEYIDKTILNELSLLTLDGTVCDLGCGDGRRLSKICKSFKCKGLGFELKSSILKYTRSEVYKSVQIQEADITKLHGTWNDVNVLIQVMVMHDFTPESKCMAIINSFLSHFPNLKFFLYCDIVAPSHFLRTQLPGFDYIHSLLGIKTRTYEETIKLFKKAKLQIAKEIPIIKMPNTFLWVLTQKNG